ncbi:hypothetical protein ABZ885_32595, partial [Kitasatospora sp. NPDC047058]
RAAPPPPAGPAGDGGADGPADATRGIARVSAGGYAAVSGPPTGAGPLGGAPQPGQARAPFRWRRQGAQ